MSNRLHTNEYSLGPVPAPDRRAFVKGLAAATLIASAGISKRSFAAETQQRVPQGVLSGTDFELAIGATTVNITGRERNALTINDSLPGPLLRWREGDTVTLRVRNETRDERHVDPLARDHPARKHGRCARPQLCRHPARG